LLQGLLYLSRVRYTEQGLQNEGLSRLELLLPNKEIPNLRLHADDLERAGELLKLETSSHKLFERYTIYDDNEKIKITSSVHRANNFLRMTVQYIYGKIVAWILRAMNKKLAPMNTKTPKEAPIHFEVLNYSSPKLRMVRKSPPIACKMTRVIFCTSSFNDVVCRRRDSQHSLPMFSTKKF
jgi:hypothetical protein